MRLYILRQRLCHYQAANASGILPLFSNLLRLFAYICIISFFFYLHPLVCSKRKINSILARFRLSCKITFFYYCRYCCCIFLLLLFVSCCFVCIVLLVLYIFFVSFGIVLPVQFSHPVMPAALNVCPLSFLI